MKDEPKVVIQLSDDIKDHKGHHNYGLRLFALAMIERAVLDYSRGTEQEKRSARGWFWPHPATVVDAKISFQLCCDILDLSPNIIRNELPTLTSLKTKFKLPGRE